MKRCPRCHREFSDEWLTFCTEDGTSLMVVEPELSEPPPTLINPPLPPSVSPSEQPTLDLPDRYAPPAFYTPPTAPEPIWRPPPPPPYPVSKQQNLAITSFILGLVSMSIGLCCWLGVLTAPVGLVLGIVALVQIKNEPHKIGGKGLAIAGVILSGLYFIVMSFFMLLWGTLVLGGIG